MKHVIWLVFFLNTVIISNALSCNIIIENEYPSITSPRCGVNNGRIEILATGQGKVKYKLNNSAYQEQGFFDGLGAGQYVIKMTDESGCEKKFTTTLESLTGVSIEDVEVENSQCDKSSGSITIRASGEGLKYRLNNGVLQTSNKFTGLPGGKYTVSVVDALKCEETKIVTISQGTITINSISTKKASCANKNGFIEIEAQSVNRLKYKLVGISKWQNKNRFDNLPPGKYSVIIRESTGCELKKNVVIGNEYRVQIEKKNPVCGKKNGSVIVSTSIDDEFEYSIDNGKTWSKEGLFENLEKGSYTVFVKGIGNECSSKQNFTLQEEKIKIPDLTIQTTPVSCLQADGEIKVLTTASNLTYQLFLKNGSSPIQENKIGEFVYLKEGNYKVKVITDENCESEWYNTTLKTANDIQLEDPKLVFPNCNTSSGSISIHAKSNRKLKLTYSINGVDFSENSVFENLETGNYTFTIRSESNCTKVVNYFLSENNIINFVELTTEPPTTDCSKDGQIQAFANSDDVQYSLDNMQYQQSGLFKNLGPGKYTVYIKNSAGCIRQSGRIHFLGLIGIDEIETVDDTCNDAQGQATIKARGKNLVFSLDGKIYQKSNHFTELNKGKYTAYVSDGSECVVEKDFQINNNGRVVLKAVDVETTRCGLANGKAIISYLDEGVNYQFKLDDGPFQAEPVFTDLTGGKHMATIKGENNCERSLEFTIPESFPINVNIENTLLCGNAAIDLEITATGGVGQLQYALDDLNFDTTSIFRDLSLGNHTIQIKDEVGCIFEQEVNVGKTKIETVEVTPNSCKNENARLEVKYTDFGGQYQFKLDENAYQNSPIFNSVKSGNHVVTIRDQVGCESSYEVEMQETFPLQSNIEEQLIFCSETLTYPFEIKAEGGVGTLEYSYNGGEFSTQKNYELPRGIHRFKVRDEVGCILEGEVKIGKTKIETVEVTPISCKNENARLEVKYTDFGGQYQFKLDENAYQNSPIFNSVKSGNHVVTIRDQVGCESSYEVEMPETFPLQSNIEEQLIFCSETLTYPFEIKAEGGVGTLEYSYNGGEFSTQKNYELLSGIHYFEIRDQAGCVLSGEIKIGHAKISTLEVKTTSCGLNNGEAFVTIEDFGNQYSVLLNDDIHSEYKNGSHLKNLAPGEYTITVNGSFGCQDSRTFTIEESSPITHNMDDLSEWCRFQDGEIVVNAQGGVGTLRFALNNGEFTINNRFTDVPDGTNTIQIIDDVGCLVKHTLKIGTNCKASFSSAITPNRDGKNDYFHLLYYKPVQIHKLTVFNRWGGLVHKEGNFISTDVSKWWHAHDAIAGTYAVYVEYELGGETKFYKGFVQVMF